MEALAVLLPLIGAALAGAIAFLPTPRKEDAARYDRLSQLATCGAMVLAAIVGVYLFYDVVVLDRPRTVTLFTWIDSGALEVSWAVKLDALSAVMVATVNVVAALIHI